MKKEVLKGPNVAMRKMCGDNWQGWRWSLTPCALWNFEYIEQVWDETTVFSKVTRAGGTNMANFIDLVLKPSKSQETTLFARVK